MFFERNPQKNSDIAANAKFRTLAYLLLVKIMIVKEGGKEEEKKKRGGERIFFDNYKDSMATKLCLRAEHILRSNQLTKIYNPGLCVSYTR